MVIHLDQPQQEKKRKKKVLYNVYIKKKSGENTIVYVLFRE